MEYLFASLAEWYSVCLRSKKILVRIQYDTIFTLPLALATTITSLANLIFHAGPQLCINTLPSCAVALAPSYHLPYQRCAFPYPKRKAIGWKQEGRRLLYQQSEKEEKQS